MLDERKPPQLACRMVSGEPISPPDNARAAASGLAAFHLLYSSQMLTVYGSGRLRPEDEPKNRSANWKNVAPSARRLASSSVSTSQEVTDQRDVRVRHVVAQFLLPFGERVIIGVHPRERRVGREELEPQSAHAAAARHFQSLELRACDP